MTHPAPIRTGLIGYGLGGQAFHAPFIATTPGLELAAIVTGDAERQQAAANAHPRVRVIATAEELLDRRLGIELVVISTPNRTHVPLARAALEAGRHVVIDKPFAPTAAEGRALVGAARERELQLSVYHNRRWDGDFRTVQRLLAAGAVGTPTRFESRFERWRPEPRLSWRERGAPEEAGGILFDLGSHLIDQALVLFGPVRDVYAEIHRRRAGVEADDDVFLALTHHSGVQSHLHMSALAAQPGPRFRLLGTDGAFTKWGTDVQEASLRAGAVPAGSPAWGCEPEEQWGTLGTGASERRVPSEAGDYGAFYRGMVAAIGRCAAVPVEPLDAIAGLEIIEAARESALRRIVVAPG